jgi:hypothetical protein
MLDSVNNEGKRIVVEVLSKILKIEYDIADTIGTI